MATLNQRLAEAEAAYHDLVLGKAPREIRDSDGSQIVYTAANPARLLTYIAKLKEQIGSAGSGPMYLVMC